MLTRIRNAVHARHARVELPASKLKIEIAKILQDEGYIAGYKLVETPSERPGKAPRQTVRVFLKYGPGGERVTWYLGFAPAGSPRHVLALVLENERDLAAAEAIGRAILGAAP